MADDDELDEVRGAAAEPDGDEEPDGPGRLVGAMRPARFALIGLLALVLLLGGCAGAYVLALKGIDKLKQVATVEISLQNDLKIGVGVESCRDVCEPGDILYARSLVAPGQAYSAGRFFRMSAHSFAITNNKGRRLGCLNIASNSTDEVPSYTVAISTMRRCPRNPPPGNPAG